ncbi:MAG: HRDC domain-containing protein [Bacteroidota bacterium]
MTDSVLQHTFIKTEAGLRDFADENKGISWLGFDTEFIGEKRYYTLLCLIQVSTEHGYYLIDPLAIDDLDPFLDMLEDPDIVTITHAGDNDYRLLYQQFDLVPQNLFDTQVAAGFIGHRYPMSFGKLVEAECGDRLGKGYAVTDWSQRPMSQKQVKYALNDVIYLKELYDKIMAQLAANGRQEWALEECNLMAQEAYYQRDPNHEFLNSNLARSSRTKERVFLLRLYEWRRSQAEDKNYSKEMILQSKVIGQLVRGVRGGKDAMLENRRLPTKTVKRYGDMFIQLYNQPATEEELKVVRSVQRPSQEEEEDDMLIELLYLIMKYRANEADISHSLVMPRNAIKRMKQDPTVRKSILGSGWRQELLGQDFVNWVKNFEELTMTIEGGKIALLAG